VKLRHLCAAVPAVLAVLAVAAAADTVTYNFAGTTSPSYYQNSVIGGSWNFTGTFTFNRTNNTISAFSFDFSPGAGVPNNCCNTGTDTLNPVDNNGGYVLDSSDGHSSVFANTNGWAYEISFGADSPFDANANPNITTSFGFSLTSFAPGGFYNGEIHQFPVGTGTDVYEENLASGTFTQVTPEPSTWTLLGAGALMLAGLALWSDRRRQASL
jgi:MYXO-CTERM domain-containing protein